MPRPRQALTWWMMVALCAAWGSGCASQTEPEPEPADMSAARDAQVDSAPGQDADAELDAQPDQADAAPDMRPTYQRIRTTEVNPPPTCDQVCSSQGLRCDGMMNNAIIPGAGLAGRAEYGDTLLQTLPRCDQAPSPGDDTAPLKAITCFCR